MTTRHYQLIASTSLIALIALCIAWEGWLAPLRPGGSWMTLKGALLLLPLFGVLRGKRYTYKWLSLFVQFYLLEGLTRATSDTAMAWFPPETVTTPRFSSASLSPISLL